MDWTVGKKMFLIGFISVIGISITAGNNILTNRSIRKYSQIEALKNDQINTVNKTLQSQLNLMLNAIEAIIDKDTGEIKKERLDVINESVSYIQQNLSKLKVLADTEEKKNLVKDLGEAFSILSTGIQKNLVSLIQENGARMTQIQFEFDAMVDELDKDGASIEEGLLKIYSSVAEEQKEATDLSILRNQQLDLVNGMIRAHGNLMLTAMVALKDKNKGKIDEERLKGINDNVAYVSGHLDELGDLGDSEDEKKSARFIKDTFPKLAENIQVDLKHLIEYYAMNDEFKKISDNLENYGDPIEKALAKIYKSVSEKRTEANNLAVLQNTHKGLLNDLLRSHSNLMLAAMDSIIDKDHGRVDIERVEAMNKNSDFILKNLDALIAIADTGEEKNLARFIKENFPEHSRKIQVDLITLIEESGAEVKLIAASFAKIDNDLDKFGNQIKKNLLGIQAFVQEEVALAREASEKILSRSQFIGWITSLAVLTALIVALLLISRSIIGPIRRISGDLHEGANQASSAAEQVFSSSQSLAEGASQQAASIEETSSSMEEMYSMTQKNAENAGQADNLMKDANKVVGTANQSMGQLTQSMEDISKASEETSKIIKTIDEIAFQTNLLALNAAVEAARAGEAGAGFAVVADEVRNLAMRAADAAKNTAALIEGTVKKVNDGSELVSTTNDAFSKVAESSAKVGDIVSEIAAASKEQSSGIEQVNIAITEMDKVVQQNAANAEESASASEEMSAQAEQLKDYVGDLVMLVTGKDNQTSVVKNHHVKNISSKPRSIAKAKNKLLAGKTKEVRPDQVIPFDDDDDFKDF